MSLINLMKLYKTYVDGIDDVDAQQVQLDDIVSRVKLNVKPNSTNWTKFRVTDNSTTKSGTVNISSDCNSTSGQVHANKDTGDEITVTLETGIVKGVNRLLKVPLDKHAKKIINVSHLEINPGLAVSTPTLNKIHLRASIEGEIEQGASGEVSVTSSEYAGRFTCTVEMHGIVLARGFQQDIAEVVQSLQERSLREGQDLPEDLAALKVRKSGSGKVVEFKMEGEVEIKKESQWQLEWK